MKKITALLACASIIYSSAYSQWELGGEYQHGFGKNYNSNSIGGIYEGFSKTGKSSWQIGLNYTFSTSGTGKEAFKGSGIGLSLGYRYGFSYGTSGNLFAGARASFTFSKDDKGTGFSVFTPSVESGYHYTFNNFGRGGFATPSLSIGYDIKINGEKESAAVDEGAVFSPRLAIGYRF